MLGLPASPPYPPSPSSLRAVAMRLQGWPQRDIRERCGLPPNSVHRRTARAAARLLTVLEPEVLEALRDGAAAGVVTRQLALRASIGVSLARLATEPWPPPVPTGWSPRTWRTALSRAVALREQGDTRQAAELLGCRSPAHLTHLLRRHGALP